MFAALARNDSYLTISKEQRIAIRKERRARLNRSPEVQLRQMYNEAPSMTDPPIEKELSAVGEESSELQKRVADFIVKWKKLEQHHPAAFSSIRQIQFTVLTFYPAFTIQDLCSEQRTFQYARMRHIAMYLCKTETNKSLPEIGRRFGGRDHTTVLHGVRKITRLIETDPELAAHVQQIREAIHGNPDS